MRRLGSATIPFLVLMVCTGPVLADAGDMKLRFGFTWLEPTNDINVADDNSFWYLNPSDELAQVDIHTVMSASPSGGGGFNVGFEFLVTKYLGVDVNLGYSKIDFDPVTNGTITVTPLVGDPPTPDTPNAETGILTGEATGELGMIPFTIGFNFYVLRNRVVDLYVGPLIGYVKFTELHIDPGTLELEPEVFPLGEPEGDTVEIRDSASWGVTLGADFRLGHGKWMISTALRYVQATAEEEGGERASMRIDPWIALIGAGYRF